MSLIILLSIILVLIFAVAFIFFFNSQSSSLSLRKSISSMTVSELNQGQITEASRMNANSIEKQLEKFASKRTTKKKNDSLDTRLFKAGFYTSEDRAWYRKFRMMYFFGGVTILPLLGFFFFGSLLAVFFGLLLGAIIGLIGPSFWLDKQIRIRREDTLYFLPLVIEQISIGVSSALDIGPCLAMIESMADERDSHNPVTEMLVQVQKLIRAGLNLENSLVEVSEANGMNEVKHAFLFLAQCSKHGGELSKQLQELADSVMVQRQTQVEARITALPVKATGPLTLVFGGFLIIILAGLFVRVGVGLEIF